MFITRQMLRDWKACYNDDKIAKYVPEEGLTPLQVLDLDIHHNIRRRIVMREAIIPAQQRIELACLWAERALLRIKEPRPHSWSVVEITRRYARGEATIFALRAVQPPYYADCDVATFAVHVADDAYADAAQTYTEEERQRELDQQIEDIRSVLKQLYPQG